MSSSSPRIVYSPGYNIRYWGIEKLHPFDSRKFQHAWDILARNHHLDVESKLLKPDRPASEEEILSVHSAEYLKLLESSRYIAQAFEIPLLGVIPRRSLDKHVLRPMRLATRGTILAAREALRRGAAINLGGGYHHASRERGEGSCVYADIPIAIACLRREGHLSSNDRVAIIDLDAHQGNGVERIFRKDDSIFLLDMYNSDIYPRDEWAKKRINTNIPIPTGTDDETYLSQLKSHLPKFLAEHGPFSLAIYNAGTDIYRGDPLGRLSVSASGILERDRFVMTQLASRETPWVMLPSGGYTKHSARLIADSIAFAVSELKAARTEFDKRAVKLS